MDRKIAAAILGLWITSSWTAAGLAGDASAGKAVYEKSCAGCHGPDGKGNEKMAKLLGDKGLNIVGDETKKQTDEQLLKLIADGAGKMPASKLTKEEQKQALGYVRSLAK
jgi:mono/diheme cytochrome c family protein